MHTEHCLRPLQDTYVSGYECVLALGSTVKVNLNSEVKNAGVAWAGKPGDWQPTGERGKTGKGKW